MRRLNEIIADLAEAQMELSAERDRHLQAQISRAMEFGIRELGLHKRDVHRADLAYVPDLSNDWQEREQEFVIKVGGLERKIAELVRELKELETSDSVGGL